MIKNFSHNRLALITPLKDEIQNIDSFLSSISSLNKEIDCLVILENDSTDGSKEYLEKIKELKNVKFLKVINLSFEDKSYDIEFKYAQIIIEGLNFIKNLDFYEELDFIGILDSDCFPENDYYDKLIQFLFDNPKVGITSGLIYLPNGKRHIANINWVRGGCRIWRKKCLEQTGFPVAPSPDAITVALAEIHGWEAKTCKSASVYSREVNQRLTNYKNFGARAYFRGNTLMFAIFKLFYFTFFKLKPKVGVDFLNGFLDEYFKGSKKIDNPDVVKYYKYYFLNKIKKRIGI